MIEPQPIVLEDADFGRHLLTPWFPFHLPGAEWHNLDASQCGNPQYVSFGITVSAAGVVRSARLLPEEVSCHAGKVDDATPPYVRHHLREVNALLYSTRFRPWVINQHASSVVFNVSLPLAPPERFGPPRSFPGNVDLSSVTIGLERRGCEGLCPAYSLLIRGDGSVIYEGNAYVAIEGPQVAQLPVAKISALLEKFRASNYLAALQKYSGAFDGGDAVLSLTLNGKTYSVEDESGELVGLPDSIFALELAVDETAGSARWVIGNQDQNIALDIDN